MDDKQLKLLSDKMDIMIRLLAMNAVSGKPVKEQIRTLNSLGMTPKQIADALGKTQNQVNVTLHQIRGEDKEAQSGESQENSQSKQDQKGVTQTTLPPSVR